MTLIHYQSKEMRNSRYAYIAEAALEYLVALLVQGTFLTQITMELGFTDSQIGVISSVISLGCLFQLVSMVLRRKTVKRFVLGASIANQLLFMLLYAVPIVPMTQSTKQIVFLGFMFTAYAIYYFAHPKKTGWLMSLVEDGNRGRFTATKEIISLAAGMVFTYIMGSVVDSYRAAGNTAGAFLTCALVILGLSILHTVTMAVCVEPDTGARNEKVSLGNFLKNFVAVAKHRKVRQVAAVFVLWYFGSHFTTGFYGTFQLRELGMNQSTVALLTAAGSLVRMVVSRPLGTLADRFSFTTMIRLCMALAIVAFGSVALATPATGVFCFLVYYMFHGAAMGGINSALINMVFDFAPAEQRADSVAFCQSLAGICGFAAGVIGSRFLEKVQGNGNTLFGISVYAQQVTSLVAVAFAAVAVLYITVAFRKKQ